MNSLTASSQRVPAVGAGSADSTAPRREGIKAITNLKGLPQGGRLIDPELPPLNMPVGVREQFAIWEMPEDSRDGKRVVCYIAAQDLINSSMYHQHLSSIRRHFRVEHRLMVVPELLPAIYEQMVSDRDDKELAKDNDLGKFYEEMVRYALKERVSDIHIEKRARIAVVRMRKHGQLTVWKEIGAAFATSLASVIYNVLAENKDIAFRETVFQSAAINTWIANTEVKLRYQSLPVYPGGFDVVLRVLPLGTDDEKLVDPESLGYARSQMDMLWNIVSKPVGALIIAGTTGSGKSTTLKNLLMYVNSTRNHRCKIYTIEDPPEYRIPHTSQIPVIRREDEKKNVGYSPFEEPLKATMRGDPDILMIGEIRDFATGDGMKKANQSGHQVMTTLHASSALGSMNRLVDFGITPNVLGSPEFINGLVYQKLVPTVCPHCSVLLTDIVKTGEVSEDKLALAKRVYAALRSYDLSRVRLRSASGCRHCGGMGVSGRTVCAEIIAPDFVMLKHFREGHDIEAYKYWRSLSDGNLDSDNMTGKTVLEHALTKIRDGIVSPEDVEELLGPVDAADRLLNQLKAEEASQMMAPRPGAPAWQKNLGSLT